MKDIYLTFGIITISTKMITKPNPIAIPNLTSEDTYSDAEPVSLTDVLLELSLLVLTI